MGRHLLQPHVRTRQRLASDQTPPFATIAKMLHLGAGEIAPHLLSPHPKMPDMNLTRTEAGDLAAFITDRGRVSQAA